MIADTQALRSKLSETIDSYEYKMFKKPDLHPCASLLCTPRSPSQNALRQALLPVLHVQPSRRPQSPRRAQGLRLRRHRLVRHLPLRCAGQRPAPDGSAARQPVRAYAGLTAEYHQIHKNVPQTDEEICTILVDAFQSAAERDIYTGDAVEVVILRKGQPEERRRFKIRSD